MALPTGISSPAGPIPLAITLVSATVSQLALQPNSSRKKLIFHNPNLTTQINIAICPSFDVNGNNLPAGFGANGALAGSLLLLPAATMTIEADDSRISNGWNAASASGSNIPLTIWEFPQQAGG
jgi:hypothetical protein